MTVRVKLFALAKQLAGRAVVELELPAGSTVADLRRRLVETIPEFGPLQTQLLFAVERAYAADQVLLRAGAEVACFPPVSGG